MAFIKATVRYFDVKRGAGQAHHGSARHRKEMEFSLQNLAEPIIVRGRIVFKRCSGRRRVMLHAGSRIVVLQTNNGRKARLWVDQRRFESAERELQHLQRLARA